MSKGTKRYLPVRPVWVGVDHYGLSCSSLYTSPEICTLIVPLKAYIKGCRRISLEMPDSSLAFRRIMQQAL